MERYKSIYDSFITGLNGNKKEYRNESIDVRIISMKSHQKTFFLFALRASNGG